MYVFWTARVPNGSVNAKPQFKNYTSAVHLEDQHTTIRTACNTRIPTTGTVHREKESKKLPLGVRYCKACFR
jgi:hypothetical protein